MKFGSLSQLLGWTLFGPNSGPFIAPGIKKKKGKEGRKEEFKRERGRRNKKGKKGRQSLKNEKNIEGRKEEGIKDRREGRRNKKGKKERKEEGIKKEKKTKGSFLLASNRPNKFSWSSWLQQAEGGLVGLGVRCLWAVKSDSHCPRVCGCKHSASSVGAGWAAPGWGFGCAQSQRPQV